MNEDVVSCMERLYVISDYNDSFLESLYGEGNGRLILWKDRRYMTSLYALLVLFSYGEVVEQALLDGKTDAEVKQALIDFALSIGDTFFAAMFNE